MSKAMSNAYTRAINPVTPQSEPLPGRQEMVQNSAGGYVFQVPDLARLERFLILGTEGGTYYIKERELTKENTTVVQRCLDEQPYEAIRMIADISWSGRARSNEPALYALALAASHAEDVVRKYALDNLRSVARTGTHLFHFAEYVNGMRGWGRGLRTAIANWYKTKSVKDLVYQLIKYQQRDGWSHADLLRLSHPKTDDEVRNAVYKWVVDGVNPMDTESEDVHQIRAMEYLKTNDLPEKIASTIISVHNLPWEAIPSHFLNNPKVWQVILQNNMPMTALIRNLPKMTSLGMIGPMSANELTIANKLEDKEASRKARIHPLTALVAKKHYAKCENRNMKWSPNHLVLTALETLFYNSFQTIEPSNKRTLLALDVSGSMTYTRVAGIEGFMASEIAAVMAMVIARSEPRHHIMGFATEFVDLGIRSNMSLDQVANQVFERTMGGTDLAQPMIWAKQNNVEVDTFVIITDNETWAGAIHPKVALDEYRKAMGIPAKLVVMGVSSTGFTIADPNDPGMLDVVGCDTGVPALIAEFSKM